MLKKYMIPVICLLFFMTGFHNLDTGQNMRYLNAEFGLNLGENGVLFKDVSPETTYISGVVLILISFWGLLVFSMGVLHEK